MKPKLCMAQCDLLYLSRRMRAGVVRVDVVFCGDTRARWTEFQDLPCFTGAWSSRERMIVRRQHGDVRESRRAIVTKHAACLTKPRYIHWERLCSSRRSLRSALSTITAAVVGVILNLAIWFGLHTLFAVVSEFTVYRITLQVPDINSIDWMAVLLAGGAIIVIFRFRASVVSTLAGCAAAGVLLSAIQ